MRVVTKPRRSDTSARARGLEAKLVPEAGFEVTLLPGRGIQRRLTPDNLGAIAGLMVAFVLALGIVIRRRPRVVVTVGGYAGLPCAFAAIALRVPVVVLSYDAVAGSSNRLVARFARKCAVAFEGAGLPNQVVTGAPLRSGVLEVDRTPQGVATGSLCHRGLAKAVPSRRRRWLTRRRPAQRGRLSWQACGRHAVTSRFTTSPASATSPPFGHKPPVSPWTYKTTIRAVSITALSATNPRCPHFLPPATSRC